MKKTAASLFPALALLLLGAFTQAQAKPNFSGEWKLDTEKSNFGQMPVPSALTRKIEHADPKLHVVTMQSGDRGDRTSTADYTTDGVEGVNKMGDMEAKTTAVWDGDALVITTKMDVQGSQIVLRDKWTLSEDGQTLTSAFHGNTPQGEFDITLVMKKQ